MDSWNYLGWESNFFIMPPARQSEFIVNYLHVAGSNLRWLRGRFYYWYISRHMNHYITEWLTEPSQALWTDNQPICQVVYISVFCCQKYNYSSRDLICPDVPKNAKRLRRSILNIFFFEVIYLHIVHPPPPPPPPSFLVGDPVFN